MMGYDGLQDGIGDQRRQNSPGGDGIGMMNSFDIALARRRFPAIIVGDSSFIELYEENLCNEQAKIIIAENFSGITPAPMGEKWVEPDKFSDNFLSLETSPLKLKSSFQHEVADLPLVVSHSFELEVEPKRHRKAAVKKSSTSKRCNELKNETVQPTLDSPINSLSGLTTRQRRLLEKCGLHTLRKLLSHFPRTYADLRNAQDAVGDGQYLIFVGNVLSSRGIKASSSLAFFEVVVACELANDEGTSVSEIENVAGKKKKIYLHLKKYFSGARFTSRPFLLYLQSKYTEGNLVFVSGKVKKSRSEDHYEMTEYSIDMLEEKEESDVRVEGRPYPIYPSKSGLKPSQFRDFISRALGVLPSDIDPIPNEVRKEFNLLDLNDAYVRIHCPMNLNDADLARRRLIFDEFFYIQLGRLFQMLEALGTRIEKEGLLDKYRKHELNIVSIEDWSSLTKNLLKALPYSLTPSQLNAASEIIWDLRRPVPMNRLLQGDVGCGKTVVAFLACMEVVGSGYQGLADGDIALVIGTHSLISDNVEFSALRIAIIDEQQRFGVVQRGRFNSKLYSVSASSKSDTISDDSSSGKTYMAPHVLAVSATPIPRTLALALYGDMSLTQITDLPPGRMPIDVHILQGNETGFEDMYQKIRDELLTGGNVYLVYPIINESEHLPQLRAVTADFDSISGKFKGYQCGLLHGRMKSEEKDEQLRNFRSGETRILLSTQVIEIGVDVPTASMMVVMNAERFGIAQLHQLRGRVGRGERKSKCIFITSTAAAVPRLKVLKKSSDGFYLANADLLLRGPGDLLGKKQSGHVPEFPIARLEVDGNILQEAHHAALKVLSNSSDLSSFPKLKAELSMRQPLCLLGD
ncbi:DEAD-box ATP-dependent RNA helicase 2 [Acorus gramineus]|uniref:DEAD-box ATP-dependent RNA helicase 2 n=1 Tax=Acorus gramineus TaxID=55184 RepID=A0AAV9BY53_ACOGR|nr:DEAD-box ATP-dependent RNA helicase 2 [Acorus gramineus]